MMIESVALFMTIACACICMGYQRGFKAGERRCELQAFAEGHGRLVVNDDGGTDFFWYDVSDEEKEGGEVRSPIFWFGGKGHMVEKVLPYLTRWKHDIYVEPFGGGASLLFAKPPASVEVYNDLDSGLYDFFTVISDPRMFARFYRRVQTLLYSRELYNDCRKTWALQGNKIDRAVKYFVVARMSFGGRFGSSWGFIVSSSTSGMAKPCFSWMRSIEHLPEIHKRISVVQIDHDDFRTVIERYDTEKTLFYLDPPYVPDTRKSGKYKHEMTAEDHDDLVSILLDLQGAAVLSGYPTDLYDSLHWKRFSFETSCHAAGRTRYTGILGPGAAKEMQPRIEHLWVHPRIMEGSFVQEKLF